MRITGHQHIKPNSGHRQFINPTPRDRSRTGQITSYEPLDNGRGPTRILVTDAYGGCYIDYIDFSEREQIGPNLWRMYDHEDEAIEEAGPLWQYADGRIVAAMADFFRN